MKKKIQIKLRPGVFNTRYEVYGEPQAKLLVKIGDEVKTKKLSHIDGVNCFSVKKGTEVKIMYLDDFIFPKSG